MPAALKKIFTPFSLLIAVCLLLTLSIALCFYSENEKSKRHEHIVHLHKLQHKVEKIELEIGFIKTADSGQFAPDRLKHLHQELHYISQDSAAFLYAYENTAQPWILAVDNGPAVNTPHPQKILSRIDAHLTTVTAQHRQYINLLDYAQLGSGSLLLLLLAGLPLYGYYGYNRPLKTLITLIDEEQGNSKTPEEKTEESLMPQLAASIKNLCLQHHSAAEFVEQMTTSKAEAELPPGLANRFGTSLLRMQQQIRQLSEQERKGSWINENMAVLERILKTEEEAQTLHIRIISHLAKSVASSASILYGLDDSSESPFFHVMAQYGGNPAKNNVVYIGNGQLGEMGAQKKIMLLKNVPNHYLQIQSGLGEAQPANVLMVPLLFKNNLYGALEIASHKTFEENEIAWLERAAESLAAHFFNQKVNAQVKKQLEDLAKKQADELVEIHRLQDETYAKLQVQLEEVEGEKNRNHAILEGCVDAVISFDEAGNIHFCNSAAAELFAISKETMLKKQIAEYIPVAIRGTGHASKPYYNTGSSEKEITVRTEAAVTSAGEPVDVLITSTQVDFQHQALFTFFIQKISVDLF